MKQKKPPIRMCAGCQQRRIKRELVRVVRGPDGTVFLDATGKMSGRGAYICQSPQCLRQARKARRLERALSCRIPDEVYGRLEEELEKGEG